MCLLRNITLDPLPPKGLLELMNVADASLPPHKEITIFNPELMSHELHATLFLEMQRVVRKHLSTRGLHSKATDIMQHVHRTTDVEAHMICSCHDFLR